MALDHAAKEAIEFFKNNLRYTRKWPNGTEVRFDGQAFNTQSLQGVLAQLQTQRLEPSKILVSRSSFDELLRDKNINPTPNAEFFVSAHNAGRAVDIVVSEHLNPGEIYMVGPEKQLGRISNV